MSTDTASQSVRSSLSRRKHCVYVSSVAGSTVHWGESQMRGWVTKQVRSRGQKLPRPEYFSFQASWIYLWGGPSVIWGRGWLYCFPAFTSLIPSPSPHTTHHTGHLHHYIIRSQGKANKNSGPHHGDNRSWIYLQPLTLQSPRMRHCWAIQCHTH